MRRRKLDRSELLKRAILANSLSLFFLFFLLSFRMEKFQDHRIQLGEVLALSFIMWSLNYFCRFLWNFRKDTIHKIKQNKILVGSYLLSLALGLVFAKYWIHILAVFVENFKL